MNDAKTTATIIMAMLVRAGIMTEIQAHKALEEVSDVYEGRTIPEYLSVILLELEESKNG